MTPETYILIKDELTKYLNREPSEDEIQNAQTDSGIMGKVQEKVRANEIVTLKGQINEVQSDIATVNISKIN